MQQLMKFTVAMLAVAALVACGDDGGSGGGGGGDDGWRRSRRSGAPIKVEARLQPMVPGGVTIIDYTIRGKPGTHILFAIPKKNVSKRFQIKPDGKVTFRHNWGMRPGAWASIWASAKPIEKTPDTSPLSVYSLDGLGRSARFDGACAITIKDFGPADVMRMCNEWKLFIDGKPVDQSSPPRVRLDIAKREGLAQVDTKTGGIPIVVSAKKGPVTAIVPIVIPAYERIMGFFEKGAEGSGARFAGEPATHPKKPRSILWFDKKGSWRHYQRFGTAKRWGDYDVVAYIDEHFKSRKCHYGRGRSRTYIIIHEGYVDVHLRWRVTGATYLKRRFKAKKKTRCPSSVTVGLRTGTVYKTRGGVLRSSASRAEAIAWVKTLVGG